MAELVVHREVHGTPVAVQAPVPSEDAQPDAAVMAALGDVRRVLARETGYAAYLVFPNASLAALATRKPRTMADLAGIPGLGPKRIDAYGERILAAVAAALDALAAPAPTVPAPPTPAPTPEMQHVPALLEHVAQALRAGRHQGDAVSGIRAAFPEGNEFIEWHVQELDGTITVVLRSTSEDRTGLPDN
ncbi:HRDC domain-containing protein [Deinococcus sonorensis]|uniref:HRDC domain-containing protein n=1 Tax=Deinococcus sonorensis TaxID=309891 RepID=A0ABV8Y8H4_9DEIO